jgi:hypothetical protein
VTAAIGAINAQLRADEQQLRRKRSGDVLERLLKLMEEERKKIPVGPIDPFSGPKAPLAPAQPTEHVERSEAEANGAESVPVLGRPSGDPSKG